MTLRKFKPVWEKLTHLPRRTLLIGGGVMAALVAVAANGFVHAADTRQSTRLAGLEIAQDDSSYTITIPDAGNSRARLRGETLQVSVRDQTTGIEGQQNIFLPDADPGLSPTLARDNGALVVTIAKKEPSRSLADTWTSQVPAPDLKSDLFARMEQMQRRMDEMFSRSFRSFGDFAAIPDFASTVATGIRPGIKLEDKGDTYVVRANIPGTDAKNLNVAVKNDNVLTITAKQEDISANRHAVSNSTQVFTLPGPVQGSKMKIDHQDQAFIITLPKA